MPIEKKYISVKFSEPQLRERNRPLAIHLEMSDFLSSSMGIEEIWSREMEKGKEEAPAI
jgi:hypothetical protein